MGLQIGGGTTQKMSVTLFPSHFAFILKVHGARSVGACSILRIQSATGGESSSFFSMAAGIRRAKCSTIKNQTSEQSRLYRHTTIVLMKLHVVHAGPGLVFSVAKDQFSVQKVPHIRPHAEYRNLRPVVPSSLFVTGAQSLPFLQLESSHQIMFSEW